MRGPPRLGRRCSRAAAAARCRAAVLPDVSSRLRGRADHRTSASGRLGRKSPTSDDEAIRLHNTTYRVEAAGSRQQADAETHYRCSAPLHRRDDGCEVGRSAATRQDPRNRRASGPTTSTPLTPCADRSASFRAASRSEGSGPRAQLMRWTSLRLRVSQCWRRSLSRRNRASSGFGGRRPCTSGAYGERWMQRCSRPEGVGLRRDLARVRFPPPPCGNGGRQRGVSSGSALP